jgi:hypothetical protein
VPPQNAEIPLLLWLAPVFLVFEIWQLVMAERLVGVKQIERGQDPRTLGPGERTALFWVWGIVAQWIWMVAMIPSRFSWAQAGCMLGVSVLGLSARRQLGLRWCLVVMTLEGAIRIGMMISLLGLAWRRL